MPARPLPALLADLVVVLHAAFIVWVVIGVFFLRRHPRLRWVHLGCVIYGFAIEVWPWICPLTYLEDWLRAKSGLASYSGSFIAHYLERFVYWQAPRVLLALLAACVLCYTLALNVLWRPGRVPAGSGERASRRSRSTHRD